MRTLRLLVDPPAAGSWNMAVDEALLETASAEGQGTLRFYEWSPATLSLGYFQPATERDQHAASRNCPLVRRASGGGAILHDQELTYSVALPQAAAGEIPANTLYDLFHESLTQTLAEFGVHATLFRPAEGNCPPEVRQNAAPHFLCFERRSCGDVVCQGFKIAGSAQRRRRGAVLQHGSLLLARSPHAPELPGIRELTAIGIAPTDLIAAWRPRLQARLGVAAPGVLSAGERSRAALLDRTHFGSRGYTHQR